MLSMDKCVVVRAFDTSGCASTAGEVATTMAVSSADTALAIAAQSSIGPTLAATRPPAVQLVLLYKAVLNLSSASSPSSQPNMEKPS